MYELPVTVTVNETEYQIRNKADYRTVLGVIDLLNDPELTNEERVISALVVFYDGFTDADDIILTFRNNLSAAIEAMMNFIGCEDEDTQSGSNIKLIDWKQDEKLIISGINSVARTEVRALEYLHWWTFISYYMAIGEGPLSTVVSIRSKIAKGKKLDKAEKEFRRENPSYFRWKNQEIEERNFIESIWNKGK